MKYLTEKLKSGKLTRGWYYVLLFSNEEYIAFIDGKWVVDDRLVESDITEVLAPVPSYEEWQATNEENKNLYKMLDVLNEHLDSLLKEDNENQQLKELLKECKANFMYRKQVLEKLEELEKPTIDILTHINSTIGER